MKQIIIFVMVLLLVMPIVSAGSSWNPIEIGKKMIADGIVNALRNLADEIMDFICGESEDDDAHDRITGMIIKFASWTVTPFAYPSIVRMLGVSFVVGIGVLIGYIFVGGGISAITGNLSNYGKNSVYSILLLSFAPVIIWIVLLFAQVLKTMLMESIANSISPSIETCTVMYFAMAVMWLFVAIFFGISNIVICLTAGLSFVLGALYVTEKTRHITTWAFDYFVTMVVMQVMVITIAVVTIGLMTDIKSGEYADIITPGMEAATYAGMILLILIMCVFMVLGKALVLKTAKTVIKLAVMK